MFEDVTGRSDPPLSRVEEALYLIGRRGGKDRAASVLATYLAALVDWSGVLAPGERGLVLCIGPDQRQARITRDYIEAVFEGSPVLAGMVASRTADAIELDNRIGVEVRAANYRRRRGVTCVACIATEAAYWYGEGSANADEEILNAVRPSASSGVLSSATRTRRRRFHQSWSSNSSSRSRSTPRVRMFERSTSWLSALRFTGNTTGRTIPARVITRWLPF